MTNIRRSSFRRITVVLATFLVTACVMATGACTSQRPPEETPVPSPTSTVEPPTPTPTPIPTVRLSAHDEAPTLACAFEPVGEFREAWSSEIGCPEGEEKVIWCAWQEFQHGYMLWRIDNKKICVFHTDGADGGSWQEYDDLWTEGKYPDSDPDIEPPPRLVQPKRGFGLIWREQLGGPKSNIGWGLTEEEGLCAVVQPFEKGVMIRYNPKEHSDDLVEKCQVWLSEDLNKFYWPRENVRVAIILYSDSSWRSYK